MMSDRGEAMSVNVGGLLRWLLLVLLPVALLGAYPTWRLGGRAALASELIAVTTVLIVMLVNGLLVSVAAQRTALAAAMTFVGGGVVRVLCCGIVAAVVCLWTPLPQRPLLGWLAVVYVLTLAVETIWLYLALRRHAHEQALSSFGVRQGPQTTGEGAGAET